MPNKPPFSKEYQSTSETKAEVLISREAILQEKIKSETKAEVPISGEAILQEKIKLDTDRYGMAKPKRIVIRANITHD